MSFKSKKNKIKEEPDQSKIRLLKRLRAYNVKSPPHKMFKEKYTKIDSNKLKDMVREYVYDVLSIESDISEINLRDFIPKSLSNGEN